MLRERSTTTAARVMTSSTLPSSEAWKEKNGSWIARCAPFAVAPSARTARIDVISSP